MCVWSIDWQIPCTSWYSADSNDLLPAGHASTGIPILHSNSRHAAFQSGKSDTVVWPWQMADNCVAPWRNAHLDVLPRCHWPLGERKWSWGNLRCCIQWYQQHVKWEGVAKGNARFLHGDHSFTAAVLLHQYILAGTTDVANIEEELEMARNTPTGLLWVDCFVIPTFLAHLFVRAEREGDWLLHMYCLRRMLPYFFASSHWNYARYIHWYIQDNDANLPPAIKEQYLTDGHTCRHATGVWNAVSEDQFGEQTYIR